jgi:hypothetical protein
MALAPRPASAADLAVAETPVGRLSLPVLPDSLIISPDSSRLAFATNAGTITLTDKGVFQNTNGVAIQGPKADPSLPKNIRALVKLSIDDKSTAGFEVLTQTLFSPDSKRLGFAGQKEGKWHIVVDNRTVVQDAEAVPPAPLAFSPDSARAAWAAQVDGHWQVAVDRAAWPPLDAAALGPLLFSPDGKHVAVPAETRNGWVVYVDGKPLPSPLPPAAAGTPATRPRAGLSRFGRLSWRPDSAAVAYYAAFPGNRWQLFVLTLDGAVSYASPPQDAILNGSPVFSPAAPHLAFATTSRGKWTVLSNTATSPVYDELLGESLTYLEPADGPPALLYLARLNKQWQLYADHAPLGEPFDAVTPGSFTRSPDRRHYAFAATRGGKPVIIRDGAALAAHLGGAGTFAFSPDSRRLAYAAKVQNGWAVAIDGTLGAATFAAVAAAPIAFSPDAATVAFVAAAPDKTWRLIVGADGGLRTKPYDAFLKGTHVAWRPDGSLVTIAIQKKVATRIEAFPKE